MSNDTEFMMAKYEDYVNKKDGKSKDEPSDADATVTDTVLDLDQDQDDGESQKQDSIPEKYRGKNVEDLVRMHQELEGRFGSQGNELGELRKAVNTLIERDLTTKAPASDKDAEEDDDVDDLDFFADPKKAVEKLVARHPAVKQAQKTTVELTQREATQEILRRHPDVDEVFKDDSFRAWVQKSPHRQRQLLAAHESFDVEAADAVLSDWKEIKSVTAKQSGGDTDRGTQQQQQKSTTVDTREADNGAVRGRGGRGGGGKIIYRADIRKLQKDDPKRYLELLPEIRKAYAQGRVR